MRRIFYSPARANLLTNAVGFVSALFFPGLLVSSPVLAILESNPFYVVHILINA